MSEPPYGHESSAIAVQRIAKLAALGAVIIIAALSFLYVALNRWVAPSHAQLIERRAQIPPAPRLQAHPNTDSETLRRQKQSLLSSWAWTDASHRFARIPIERAMSLYAQQKFASHQPDERGAAAVGVEQRLGAAVPLDLFFSDAQGRSRPLRAYLAGRPAVLVPGYYACANLCDAVRAGVAHAVAASGFAVGSDFNVLLVSIDPRENAASAAHAQEHDGAAFAGAQVERWQYLTGSPDTSAALMRAIGFRSWRDPRTLQIAHAAGLVLLNVRGDISQYLFGVAFDPHTLRLALIDASAGRIGSLVDRFVLLCCSFDPSTGRYSLLISKVLQWLGGLTALGFAVFIALLRRSELRRGRALRVP